MAVRSKQLAAGVATTTITTVYTVPAGKTCLFKSFAWYNPSGGATTTIFLTARIGGANRGIRLIAGVPANNTEESWHNIVLGPGDELRINATPASAVQFILSGAELLGVA